MIKVCHISNTHQLSDARITKKECVSLAKAGYQVFCFVRCEKSFTENGINYIKVNNVENRFFRIFFATWIVFFKSLKINPKIIHIHSPELLPFSVFYKLLGKKVIFDSHEDFVFQILHKPYLKNKIIRNTVSALFNFFQSIISLFLDKIIVVTDPMLPRFDKKKTVVISNFPLINELNHYQAKKTEQVSFVYAGGLFAVRNIKEVTLAYSALPQKTEFHILGNWDTKSYESICKNMPEWSNITYHGKVSFEKAQEIIAQSHIGILILKATPNHLLSMPIKAFEYMYNGLPFIASDFPYWKSLFPECAIFVDPNDISAITDAMDKLLKNDDLRANLSKRGKELILEKYNWNIEEVKLLQLYQDLLK